MINHKYSPRSQSGFLGWVFMLFLVLTCFMMAALAVDVGHGVLLRAELQSACDAAALAGAQDMIGCSGEPSTSQQALVETDALSVANANFADCDSVDVSFTSPAVMYNASSSSTVPIYSVEVTATHPLHNFFAPLFGCFTSPISATSRAGVFQASTTQYGSLAQVNFPIAPTIQVDANNDMETGPNDALQNLKAGQFWKIEADGSTGGGAQNSTWLELQQGHGTSPSSPLVTSQSPATQWASENNKPGVVTKSDGTLWTYVSGAGNNSATSGTKGWTSWVIDQINASTTSPKSVDLTMPIINDPNGNASSSSLNAGTELQIIGIVTFRITRTAQGPGTNLNGDATFYGSLVNALPLDGNSASTYSSFFSPFDHAGTNSGTATMRLY